LDWLEKSIPVADAAVISLEMALYGGLINSRLSNDTLPLLMDRLNRLSNLLMASHIPIFITTVVMRIPSYDGDFEEPWCSGCFDVVVSLLISAQQVLGKFWENAF
jgi:hypothetical protein